jgi:UDP-N-acetylmuramate dehydrogenase
MNDINKLKKMLGKKAKLNEPLAKHTFLKIGGPADLYIETGNSDELIKAVNEARDLNVPVTALGDGSNVLISDKGIRGLVVRNLANNIEVHGGEVVRSKILNTKPIYRWESDSTEGTFKYEFKDLDYDESMLPRVKVVMESGVDLPRAMDHLIGQGLTGLQWYAGIPGTIGGAVFNNIHGGTHFISEVIESVKVITKKGEIKVLAISEIGVDYDKSRFQKSGEIIIEATFLLYKGDTEKARFVRFEWAKRKSLQPRNSPGCAFHNITQDQKEKLGTPTTSTGFIVEHKLNMAGFRIGDAAISEAHNNFIVNLGKATAKDYLAVMKKIFSRTRNEYGILLVPEIFLLGFDKKDIEEFTDSKIVDLRMQREKEIRTVYKDSKKLFSPAKH